MEYDKTVQAEVRAIAKDKLSLTDLFVEWYIKRFKVYHLVDLDRGYCGDWADRFKSGDPAASMDRTSLRIYMDIIKGRA